MKYYRFNCGQFIKAETFEEAKKTIIAQLEEEQEDQNNWTNCTCLGLSHRYDCPEMEGVIPF